MPASRRARSARSASTAAVSSRARPAAMRAAVTSPSTVTSDRDGRARAQSASSASVADVALHLGAGRCSRPPKPRVAASRCSGAASAAQIDQRRPVVGEGLGLRGRGEPDRGERVACRRGSARVPHGARRRGPRQHAGPRPRAVRAVCSSARAAVTAAAAASKRRERGPRGLGVGRVGQAVADFGELVLEPGARDLGLQRDRRAFVGLGAGGSGGVARARPGLRRLTGRHRRHGLLADRARLPRDQWARTVHAAFAVRSDSMCASAAVAASMAAARASAASFAASRATATLTVELGDARSWSARTRVIASRGPERGQRRVRRRRTRSAAAATAADAARTSASTVDRRSATSVTPSGTARALSASTRAVAAAASTVGGGRAPVGLGEDRPHRLPPAGGGLQLARPRLGPDAGLRESRPRAAPAGAVVRHRRLAGGGERPRPLHHALVDVEPEQLLEQVLAGRRLVVQEAGELALRAARRAR